mmetsp:Transcript_20238/g.51635  ORF Transcript_20238/g.51635 Transcript_20238/m.51635 type:complete len:226 (-) Transcript_20238:2274-2951(-)
MIATDLVKHLEDHLVVCYACKQAGMVHDLSEHHIEQEATALELIGAEDVSSLGFAVRHHHLDLVKGLFHVLLPQEVGLWDPNLVVLRGADALLEFVHCGPHLVHHEHMEVTRGSFPRGLHCLLEVTRSSGEIDLQLPQPSLHVLLALVSLCLCLQERRLEPLLNPAARVELVGAAAHGLQLDFQRARLAAVVSVPLLRVVLIVPWLLILRRCPEHEELHQVWLRP